MLQKLRNSNLGCNRVQSSAWCHLWHSTLLMLSFCLTDPDWRRCGAFSPLSLGYIPKARGIFPLDSSHLTTDAGIVSRQIARLPEVPRVVQRPTDLASSWKAFGRKCGNATAPEMGLCWLDTAILKMFKYLIAFHAKFLSLYTPLSRTRRRAVGQYCVFSLTGFPVSLRFEAWSSRFRESNAILRCLNRGELRDAQV